MGCYLQITPALRSLLGYGEVRGSYLDSGGSDLKMVTAPNGETLACATAANGDLQLVLTQTSGQTNSAILPVHNYGETVSVRGDASGSQATNQLIC